MITGKTTPYLPALLALVCLPSIWAAKAPSSKDQLEKTATHLSTEHTRESRGAHAASRAPPGLEDMWAARQQLVLELSCMQEQLQEESRPRPAPAPRPRAPLAARP